MKLKFITLLLAIGLVAQAQNIQVKSQYELPINSTKTAFYPVLSEDGTKLLYSTEGYNGLYLYDFETKEEKNISSVQNSGYDPVFSNDNSKVFFRNTSYERGRRFDALESYDLRTGRQARMIKPQRNLRTARSYHNGAIVQANNRLYKTTFGRTKAAIPVYVSSENLKIYVYSNGKRTELKPIEGENINYIWASLSPDNSKILFTAVGKGTFVCDLKGKVIAKLGYLNAPVWYNDEMVVGMQDKDDGHVITSSSVILISLDGKVKKQISSDEHIAMYPSASSKAGKILYNTMDGKLVVSELTIN